MDNISIVKNIKEGPYWRVNIRPLKFIKERIKSLSEIRNYLEQCKVSLRGWDFPHIDHKNTTNGQDWVQSECEFNDIKEFWRFYKSAQFIHYFSVYEDYYMKSKPNRSLSQNNSFSGYLDIFVTLYRMTEIYEFAMRLAQKGVYENGIYISITLSGIENFKLCFCDNSRVLFHPYISSINEIPFETEFSTE